MAPPFLPRQQIGVNYQLHVPADLPPGREPSEARLGGSLNQSGRCGEEKALLPVQGIEPQPSST
jgi:hypothetical protein